MQVTRFEELETELAQLNFTYLQTARGLIQADLFLASIRLDIPVDVCRLLDKLSVTELAELAKSRDLLMAPRCTTALQARLTAIRQGAAERTAVLNATESLWAGREARS